jgi:hypothetical protein
MRQLQLFTPAALAEMRDRTASRNHSPAGDEFRREHERHRAWGLIQRHGQRLRRLRGSSCAPPAASPHESRPRDLTRPLPSASVSAPHEQQHRPAQSRSAPTSQESAHRSRATVDAAPARKGRPAHAEHGSGRDQAEPSPRLASTPSKRAPASLPLRTPSSASGRSAPALGLWPRRSRPNSGPIGFAMDAALSLAIHHPDIGPRFAETLRHAKQASLRHSFSDRVIGRAAFRGRAFTIVARRIDQHAARPCVRPNTQR